MKSLRVKIGVVSIFLILTLMALTACESRTILRGLADSAASTTASPPPLGVDPFTAAWDDRSIFQRGLVSAAQGVLTGLPGASIYRLNVQIADSLLRITGHETVCYTNRENVALNEIYVRLFPNAQGGKMTVSAVKVNGQEIQPLYEFGNTSVRVSLSTALPPGQTVILEMDFEAQLTQKGAGNYGLFGYFQGVLMLDGAYPDIPVYDDKGWHTQTPPPNADTTFNDASFYLVRVAAPASLKLAASGVEIERKIEADRQIITFVAGPARDFYMAGSPNYIKVSTRVGETILNSYALPGREAHAKLALEYAGNALRSFNQRFVLYPYPEFDVLSTPIQALGIEYAGIVGIAQELYNPEAKINGVSSRVFLESTVAHEVGHQWFYNIVGDDQVNEPWLDESLAQYATLLYYTDVYGPTAIWNVRAAWETQWQGVGRVDMPIGLPAAAYTHDQYGGIVYGRGPLFVAALAERMGQTSFDQFLRDYQQTYQWNISTTAGFKQLAEQHCQCDLTDLFKAWVYAK